MARSGSGAVPRWYRAWIIPAWMAPRATPPAGTDAVRGSRGARPAAGLAVTVRVLVLIGGQL